MKKKKSRKNLIITLIAVVAVAMAVILIGVQIIKLKQKNAEYAARKERLEQQIEEESLRREDLNDEEAYVQTRKYIEEKAKSIGYIYPDEIIFRADD